MAQLDQVIFALNPPRENMPRSDGTAAAKVAALLEWVESPLGCGLPHLEEVLEAVVAPPMETPPKVPPSGPPPSSPNASLPQVTPSPQKPPMSRRILLQGGLLAGIAAVTGGLVIVLQGREEPTLEGTGNPGDGGAGTGDSQPAGGSRSSTPTAKQPEAPNLPPSDQIDTQQLEQMLAEQRWKQADEETHRLLDRFLNAGSNTNLEGDLLVLPCDVLAAIDQRWRHYSEDKFGWSIQAQIFREACNGEPAPGNTSPAWDCFEKEVGWLVNGRLIPPQEIQFDLSAVRGHLPHRATRRFGDELIARAGACNVGDEPRTSG